ncbi:MAG: hypothetical protein ABI042_12980 [Verrucomicrobiota bacterium]
MKSIFYSLPLVILCACSPSGRNEPAQEKSDLKTKLIGTWQRKGDTNNFGTFMSSGNFVFEESGQVMTGTFSVASNAVDILSLTSEGEVTTAKILFITPDEFVATQLKEGADGEIFRRVKK